MLIFHSTFTWKHWIGLVLTSVAYAIPYQQIANMAQPSYDDNGELLDGGFDMSTGGVCGCVSFWPPLCVCACVKCMLWLHIYFYSRGLSPCKLAWLQLVLLAKIGNAEILNLQDVCSIRYISWYFKIKIEDLIVTYSSDLIIEGCLVAEATLWCGPKWHSFNV